MRDINSKQWQLPKEEEMPEIKERRKYLKDDWENEDMELSSIDHSDEEDWGDFFSF